MVQRYWIFVYAWFVTFYHIFIQLVARVSSDLKARYESEIQKRLDVWKSKMPDLHIPLEQIEKKRKEIIHKMKSYW